MLRTGFSTFSSHVLESRPPLVRFDEAFARRAFAAQWRHFHPKAHENPGDVSTGTESPPQPTPTNGSDHFGLRAWRRAVCVAGSGRPLEGPEIAPGGTGTPTADGFAIYRGAMDATRKPSPASAARTRLRKLRASLQTGWARNEPRLYALWAGALTLVVACMFYSSLRAQTLEVALWRDPQQFDAVARASKLGPWSSILEPAEGRVAGLPEPRPRQGRNDAGDCVIANPW